MNIKKITNKFPNFFPYSSKIKNYFLGNLQNKKSNFKIRSDSRTPLGKISFFDRGSAAVKSNKQSGSL